MRRGTWLATASLSGAILLTGAWQPGTPSSVSSSEGSPAGKAPSTTMAGTGSRTSGFPSDTAEAKKERGDTVFSDSTAMARVAPAPATISVPEAPSTEGFVPTVMADMPMADPTAKMTIIAPPVPNSEGTATLTYPFEMPPARNGMAPRLGLVYDSDQSDGTLGPGWDIPVSSISVDTRWGVPDYDPVHESETYLLDGETLLADSAGNMTAGHRGKRLVRQAGRHFYPRRAGAFATITRQGAGPDCDTWTITDTQGTVYTYGGPGAVLKGKAMCSDGTVRTVSVRWMLSEVKERHGDWMRYTYGTVTEEIAPGLTATTLRLDNVQAGNAPSGNGWVHTKVTVDRGGGAIRKQVRHTSAMYGFLTMTDPDLPSGVTVYHDGEKLRSYRFGYKDVSLGRKALAGIEHLDASGNRVFGHEFDYTGIGDGADSEPYGPAVQTAGDIEGALSRTKGLSTGVSLYAGVGVFDGSHTTSGTAGLQTGYTHDGTEGSHTLADIDGDGVADRLSSGHGGLVYRRGTMGADGTLTFGAPVELMKAETDASGNITTRHRIDAYEKGSVDAFSVGGNVKAGWGHAVLTTGMSTNFGTVKEEVFLTDYNADGITDIVDRGTVWFGRLVEESGADGAKRMVPVYTRTSAGTANPVVYDEAMIPDDLRGTDEEATEANVKNSPMLDAVRVWRAPQTGFVDITGTAVMPVDTDGGQSAQAQNAMDPYDPVVPPDTMLPWNDGERMLLTVQHGGDTLVSGQLGKYSRSVKMERTGLYVQRGDLLLFRLQCGFRERASGLDKEVVWEPVVTYSKYGFTRKVTHLPLPNGFTTGVYRASEGFYRNGGKGVPLKRADISSATVDIYLSKEQTTDSVVLDIMMTRTAADGSATEVRERVAGLALPPSFSRDTVVSIPIAVAAMPDSATYSAEISSPSEIDWNRVKGGAKLSVSYADASRGSVEYALDPSGLRAPRRVYEPEMFPVAPRIHKVTDTPQTAPYIGGGIVGPGEIHRYDELNYEKVVVYVGAKAGNTKAFDVRYVLKSRDGMVGSGNIRVSGAGVSTQIRYVERLAEDTLPVWAEFITDGSNERLIDSVSCNPGWKARGSRFYDGGLSLREEVTDYGPATGHTYGDDDAMGVLQRGWGAFTYRARGDRWSKPIDMADTRPETDTTAMRNGEFSFLAMGADSTSNILRGPRAEVFVSPYGMGAARETILEVVESNGFPARNPDASGLPDSAYDTGTGASAVATVRKFSGETKFMSPGVTAMDITAQQSSTTSEVKSTMLDLDGDGYPDIYSKRKVRFTDRFGGPAAGNSLDIGFTPKSVSSSTTFSLGSTADFDIPVNSPTEAVGGAAETVSGAAEVVSSAAKAVRASVSAGLTPKQDDMSQGEWADINGDGLPDIVTEDNRVRLNLGHRFSQAVSWGNDTLLRLTGTSTLSTGGGGGFSIGSGSFSGGLNKVLRTTGDRNAVTDVDGDGIPDMLTEDDEGNVILRLGNGLSGDAFRPAESWNMNGTLPVLEGSSTGGNVAGTVTIPIPLVKIKISINAGVSLARSASELKECLRDVNGDGCPDIVYSDGHDTRVRLSRFGGANLLKSVRNSLGGRFEIGYGRSEATHDHPGGKRVMTDLTVDDGIHDDGPLPRSRFSYTGGRYDRRERTFLGFGRVCESQLDADGSVYRNLVKEYDVSDWYGRGNLLSSSVTDAQGKTFSRTVNEYTRYTVKPDIMTGDGVVSSYSFTAVADSVRINDRASVYVPVTYTADYAFGPNSETGVIVAERSNSYRQNGRGELDYSRISTKGTLAATNGRQYDNTTAYIYLDIPEKHLFSLQCGLIVVDGETKKLISQVEAEYDPEHPGHIKYLKKKLDNGEAITQYSYDQYGNVTKVQLPPNREGQRMAYTYYYDDRQMYVVETRDSYGYSSTTGNIDYRYGIACSHVDINRNQYLTTIDALGRVTAILEPNSTGEGARKLIGYTYSPEAKTEGGEITAPAYAVTARFDAYRSKQSGSDPQYIRTAVLVDGFGRAIQTRKNAEIAKGANSSPCIVASGRIVYDALGRVVKSHYPVADTQASEDLDRFCKTFDPGAVTNTYDVLDRVRSTQLPTGDLTKMEYGTGTLETCSTENTGTAGNSSSEERACSQNAIVTNVTDARNHRHTSYVDGVGRTLLTRQFNISREIDTRFNYDGMGRLVTVTDAEGNRTESVYDLGGRRVSVNHPATGLTTFTYDAAGNLRSRKTANLREKGDSIVYEYHFDRLTAIKYPLHPENNVRYHYGNVNNVTANRTGRVVVREDGSGASEYDYDLYGNVTKERRTFVVPNNSIETYVTSWEYGPFGRVLSVSYPDGEVVSYGYDRGGELENVTGLKGQHQYVYVAQIGHDCFGQRTYMRQGDGSQTYYDYDGARRLGRMITFMRNGHSMDMKYDYDQVGNVGRIINDTKTTSSLRTEYRYTYDDLDRLVNAKGDYRISGNQWAAYGMRMEYDDMNRIMSKNQIMEQNNIMFQGNHKSNYKLECGYAQGRPFRLDSITDISFRTTDNAPKERGIRHGFRYDADGNMTYVGTEHQTGSGVNIPLARERKLLWDEEDRLRAISDNGFVSCYWYDADGVRTVKTSGMNESAFVDGVHRASNTVTSEYTLYVSPMFVMKEDDSYTKHFYAGAQRIASKIGDKAEWKKVHPDTITKAGAGITGMDMHYKTLYDQQTASVKQCYDELGVPYKVSAAQKATAGSPGKSGGNTGGDNAESYDDVIAGATTEPNSLGSPAEETERFYYHPDHLGSTSCVTDRTGYIIQRVEYVPFGEVFIEERQGEWHTPYLFNAKEYDEETGLYYYGARYYDPRLSIWISPDPMAEKYPHISPYCYTANNPVNAVDPDGKYILFIGGLRPCYGARDQLKFFNNAFGGKPGIYDKDITEYWTGKVNGVKVDIIKYYKDQYHDENVGFTSGSSFWNSQADQRKNDGIEKAKLFHSMVQSGQIKLNKNEPIRIIAHSQGAAHAVGFAEQLLHYKNKDGSNKYNIEIIEYICPHQPTDIKHPEGIKGIQFSHPDDRVASWNFYLNGGTSYGEIEGVPKFFTQKGYHSILKNLNFIRRGEKYRKEN